ncbi:MAG: TonB family protein [Woeseiaceae bacterium]|nr:TonB family protein [Woeseiaceae bacterium]
MRHFLAASCALAIIFLPDNESALADESVDPIDHRGTHARAIERSSPRYPQRELRSGDQGWVALSYVVTASGEVIDPVVEDSSGNRAFEQEAMNTVEKWNFEPATFDGEAVQQCQNNIMITFAIEGAEAGVRGSFATRYRRTAEAIRNGDFDRAERRIDDMTRLAMTIYEHARLSILRAQIAEARGDKEAQLEHLKRAATSGGRWIEGETYTAVLYIMLTLQLEAEKFSAALWTWEQLSEQDMSNFTPEQVAYIESSVAAIHEFVAGPEALAVTAELDVEDDCAECTADWFYTPLRRSFEFIEIDGSLDNLEIRCDWQRVVDDVAEGKSWQVPESWGDCRILVTGEPGTSFTLVELPG